MKPIVIFILSFMLVPDNYAQPASTPEIDKYLTYFYEKREFVVIGFIEKNNEDALQHSSDYSFLTNFRVTELLKGHNINGARIVLELPNSYLKLSEPSELIKIRKEQRRLQGCLAFKNGEFLKDSNDNTYCEPDISQIENKLNDKVFKQDSSLGFLLERGWSVSLKSSQLFLAFLTKNQENNFLFEREIEFIPIQKSEVQSIKRKLEIQFDE